MRVELLRWNVGNSAVPGSAGAWAWGQTPAEWLAACWLPISVNLEPCHSLHKSSTSISTIDHSEVNSSGKFWWVESLKKCKSFCTCRLYSGSQPWSSMSSMRCWASFGMLMWVNSISSCCLVSAVGVHFLFRGAIQVAVMDILAAVIHRADKTTLQSTMRLGRTGQITNPLILFQVHVSVVLYTVVALLSWRVRSSLRGWTNAMTLLKFGIRTSYSS